MAGGTPRSLEAARLLLAVAAFAPYAPVVYLATGAARADAIPWLALLAFGGAGFLACGFLVAAELDRARRLAVASAIAVGVSGSLLSDVAGALALVVAAEAALAAWSTFLHPPRRETAVAFVAYLVVGLLFVVPVIGATQELIWTAATALVWPLWLLLFTQNEIVAIWLPLAGAFVLAALAVRPRRAA